MKRAVAKFVPCSKIAKFWPNNRRVSIAKDLLNDVDDDTELLKRVLTGDETWVYGYDVETKVQ